MNFIKQAIGIILTILLTFILIILSDPVMAQTTDADRSYPYYNFRGFIQQQFVEDATVDTPTRFAIHRARFGFNGKINENIGVGVTGGFVEPPQGTPRLLHAYMDYTFDPRLTVRAGQFLIPFGIEGYEVIPLNPAIERTNVVRRLNTFNLLSDVGVKVLGEIAGFNYAVALVNGSGANRAEQISAKDVVGRMGFQVLNNLQLGASGHLGYYQPEGSLNEEERRYRAGVDVSYTGNPFFMRGEYLFRRDHLPAGEKIDMYGAYLLAGYKISGRIETIARYEYLKPDTEAANNRLEVITLGTNYYFEGRTRLSVNYELRDDDLNPDLGNILTVQMQVAI
jgi:phosphate-selective porin